ncbi:LysR family transcriptional regulator [Desulfobacter curvatus]|uniref:LysR family transcriptional regulator n=1 Tax=Desulfobacter curvatus TaxID=2290 RepID=UPI000366B330
MHNKVSWDDYRYFLKVARLGTLKAAGESLKVNHSTVLRRINALGKKLEARLFERFKSGYVLTESGQDMFNYIQHLEGEILSIERKIKGKDIRYEGKIFYLIQRNNPMFRKIAWNQRCRQGFINIFKYNSGQSV